MIEIKNIKEFDKFYIGYQDAKNNQRLYHPERGDIVCVSDKNLIEIICNRAMHFRIIAKRKFVKWYKPWTWFKYYWVLEAIV